MITIVLNIVSSLHKVFSLCARADWCDVWIEFTNLIIKVDVDVNEMPLSNIFKTRAIFEKLDPMSRVTGIPGWYWIRGIKCSDTKRVGLVY